MHLLFRFSILLIALALAGCPGTLTFPSSDVGQLDDDDDSLDDDDDSVGDDDDSVGDDDDSVSDDDDSVGDDDDSVGDDDDSVGDDDDSVGDDDDDVEPDHVNCGPWVVPSTGNDDVRVFSGDVFLEFTDANGWVWAGCEVERFFDSSGNLDCENHWLVNGQMTQWNAGSTAAEYDLDFVIQGGPTACGDSEDQDWRYLVAYDFPADTLDLSWAYPNGGGWSPWSDDVPFVMNTAETEVSFEYMTEVMEAR